MSLKSGVSVDILLHGNVAFACMMSRDSWGIFNLLTRLLGGQGERLHWSKDKAMPSFRLSVFPTIDRFVHLFLFPLFLNSLHACFLVVFFPLCYYLPESTALIVHSLSPPCRANLIRHVKQTNLSHFERHLISPRDNGQVCISCSAISTIVVHVLTFCFFIFWGHRISTREQSMISENHIVFYR